MIRHIVMWTLREAADAPRFKALLDSCAGLVPGMRDFEVAIRTDRFDATADVVLLSTFVDAAALDAYQQHPQHQTVAAQLGPMRTGRHVFDYPIPEPVGADGLASAAVSADPSSGQTLQQKAG